MPRAEPPGPPGLLARWRGRILRRFPMRGPLIYDVGANLGQDTRYYLDKGFTVLAIEADPELCAKLRVRFAEEILRDRLRVIEAGVGETHGTLPFYVNEFSEWSSFKAQSKATERLSHRVMERPVVPLRALIARHGLPYYLKLDIEGFELPALKGMGAALPRYLSFEINPDWPQILEHLAALGYARFQLIRQGKDFLPLPPSPAREGRTHAVRFENAHSGPFGRDLTGPWHPRAVIETTIETALAEARQRLQEGQQHGWFDIHARHASAPP